MTHMTPTHADRLEAAVQAVRELHGPESGVPRLHDGRVYYLCMECGQDHPCPTIQAMTLVLESPQAAQTAPRVEIDTEPAHVDWCRDLLCGGCEALEEDE